MTHQPRIICNGARLHNAHNTIALNSHYTGRTTCHVIHKLRDIYRLSIGETPALL